MYKEGSLKDQKLNEKHLISAPELKQRHLQPLCCLPENIQSDLLASVINEELSLKEMEEKANAYRQLQMVKKTFVRCTNSKNWETAEITYPKFTKKTHQFKALNFSKPTEIPEAFLTFCQAAVNSISLNVKQFGKYRVTLIEGDMLTVSMEKIKQIYNLYSIESTAGAY